MHEATLLLSRAQFALTAMFHILWPILTISLSAFILLMEALWLRRGEVVYYHHVRYWSKLLVLNFAVGVVSGLPMEFQFGTNWAPFSRFTGAFIGNILGFEGAMAFMLEAGFIGVMLWGWGKVPRKMHLFATAMVALGSTISSFWIMVANSWMQTPAGIVVENGRAVVVDYLAAIFNPSMLHSVSHMWLAAMETGLCVVAGISAWHLYQRRQPEFFARSFRIALGALLVVAPLQVLVGDASGAALFAHQPAKGAAIEGHWETNAAGSGAPWSLLAWPNAGAQRNDWSIEVPALLSVLAIHNTDGTVTGLRDIPRDEQPPAIPLLYYAFRVMAGIGVLLAALGIWSVWSLRGAGGRLEALLARRKLLLAWTLCIPLPYFAVECGWIVREVGRQPWSVYGLLRTSEAASSVSAGAVWSSTAMFLVFYAVLLTAFAIFVRKWLQAGPDLAQQPPKEFEHA
ncbi:cytochrome ubiquinol oxidase subunit I [Pseudoduganella sp. OTU4001]|uniref:cytochrome ubiquinol oxidase subunit I n=1 Tax=Pseudoduganella sp. OTU4001 TaxID=3043854 RepID=UPI00313E4EBA